MFLMSSCNVKRLMILLLFIILGMLTYLFYYKSSNERFIVTYDKKYLDPDYIPQTHYDASQHVALYRKCEGAGLLPNLPFGASDQDITAAQNKCMVGCYPDEEHKVCVNECQDTTSSECLQCVTNWAGDVTSGGEFTMPCEIRDIAPTVPTKQMIKEVAALETIGESCEAVCGYGNPEQLGSNKCTKCLADKGIDVSNV